MSFFGCSRKEEVFPAPSTGSFQLDDVSVSGEAKATRGFGSIGSTAYDFLDLDLASAQLTGDVQKLTLRLYKVPGSPANTYLLSRLSVYTTGNGSPYNFAGTSFTLTDTGEGTFSGSFTGRVNSGSSAIPGTYSLITNGVFTKVKF